MGKDIGGSIQYGYNFEMLNTFKMGHLKKPCSHIPSRMDPSQTPGTFPYKGPYHMPIFARSALALTQESADYSAESAKLANSLCPIPTRIIYVLSDLLLINLP